MLRPWSRSVSCRRALLFSKCGIHVSCFVFLFCAPWSRSVSCRRISLVFKMWDSRFVKVGIGTQNRVPRLSECEKWIAEGSMGVIGGKASRDPPAVRSESAPMLRPWSRFSSCRRGSLVFKIWDPRFVLCLFVLCSVVPIRQTQEGLSCFQNVGFTFCALYLCFVFPVSQERCTGIQTLLVLL